MPPARFSKTFFVGLESLCAHRFSGHTLTASAIRSAAFPFHFLKPRVSRAAEQPDLAAHVAALQEQIVTLKALVEQQKGNELQESGLPPYCGCPPWATHLSFPWDMRYRAGVRPHSCRPSGCLRQAIRPAPAGTYSSFRSPVSGLPPSLATAPRRSRAARRRIATTFLPLTFLLSPFF